MIEKKYSLSIFFIIAANLVPLIGAIFFNWSLLQIILIYWCETGIIGIFNILKILICTRPIFLGIFLTMFFTVHFSGFMFVHLLFISTMFGNEFMTFENGLINTTYLSPIFYSIIALFISHLVSFIYNFIAKKEWLVNNQTSMQMQMITPYKRIIVMQFVIVLGGLLITLLNLPVIGIVILVILKTLVDIDAHIKSHKSI